MLVASAFVGVMNFATEEVKGSNDYSLGFDGTDDYVEATPSTWEGPFTVTVWVKAPTGQSEWRSIFSSSDNPTIKSSFQIDIGGTEKGYPGDWRFHGCAENSTNFSIDICEIVEEWQYLTVTFDGTTIKTYLNGEFKYSDTPTFNGRFELYKIGVNRNHYRFLEGNIDDVRIYSRALSSTEISDLYQGTHSDSTGLVGHWDFEEGSGSTAYDSSGNGNDGSINGATWSTDTPSEGDTSVPSAPRNLQASAGDGQVELTWDVPSDDGGGSITDYKIYRGTTSGSLSYHHSVDGSTTSYTDSGLTNGQTYYYQVSAVNSAGEGDKSAEVSATPNAKQALSPHIMCSRFGHPGRTTEIRVVVVTGSKTLVENAEVSLTIEEGGGSISDSTGTTNSDGNFYTDLTFPDYDGEVVLKAVATSEDYEDGTDEWSITVDGSRKDMFYVDVYWETGIPSKRIVPLKNAEVTITDRYGKEYSPTTTNKNGDAFFHDIPLGLTEVEVKKDGYYDFKDSTWDDTLEVIMTPKKFEEPEEGSQNDGSFEIDVSAKRVGYGGPITDWENQEITAGDWIKVNTDFTNIGASAFSASYDMSQYGCNKGGWEFTEIKLLDSDGNLVPFDEYKVADGKGNLLMDITEMPPEGVVDEISDDSGQVTLSSYIDGLIGGSILTPAGDGTIHLPTLHFHIPSNALISEGECTLKITVEACNHLSQREQASYNYKGLSVPRDQQAVIAGDPPFEMHLYNSEGEHVGKDSDTGKIESEIDGAEYTYYDQDLKIITVPISNQSETYTVEMEGTSTEDYRVDVFVESEGDITSHNNITGKIQKGETLSSDVAISSEDGEPTITSMTEPESDKKGFLASYWWLIIAIIMGVIIAVVIALTTRKRKRPPQERNKPLRNPQQQNRRPGTRESQPSSSEEQSYQQGEEVQDPNRKEPPPPPPHKS